MYSIYKITNRMTGMSYIGITKKAVNTRWRGHYNFADRGLKYPLQEAIREYGRDAFEVTTLAQVEVKAEAYEKERAAIALFGTVHPHGYNLDSGGAGLTGRVVSAETREKIRASKLGKPGYIATDKTRQIWSKQRSGSKNWQARAIQLDGVIYPSVVDAVAATGIPESAIRYRLKIGVAQFAAPRKVRAGVGKWNIGKTHSAETRAKMSAARKGAKNWNARVIEVDGQQYPSTTDAMAALGLTRNQVRGRIKRGTAKYLTELKYVH